MYVPGAEVGEVAELRGEHLPRLALVVAAQKVVSWCSTGNLVSSVDTYRIV